MCGDQLRIDARGVDNGEPGDQDDEDEAQYLWCCPPATGEPSSRDQLRLTPLSTPSRRRRAAHRGTAPPFHEQRTMPRRRRGLTAAIYAPTSAPRWATLWSTLTVRLNSFGFLVLPVVTVGTDVVMAGG